MQAALEHRHIVGAIHLITVKIAPDLLKFGDCHGETAGFAGENDRVNSARRCTTNHSKRVRAALGQELRECL